MIQKNSRSKTDIKKEVMWWGIGLIVAGIIPFVFPELLDTSVGIIALILGIITLILRQRWNLAVIGAFIILLGALNIIATLTYQTQYGFLFFGIIQILIGVGALNQYHRLREEKNLVKNKKRKIDNSLGITSLVLGILSVLTSIFVPLIAVITGILGIVFSVKQKNNYPSGAATAGLVISIVGLVVGIIAWIITAILLSDL